MAGRNNWEWTRKYCTGETILAILSLGLLLGVQAWGAEITNVFNVRDYGAKGDGKANEQVAIQSALDACAHAGGGTVVVPPGDYLSGQLRFTNGVIFHLDAGATLYASVDPQDYPSGSAAHLLVADHAQDITLTGGGTINGRGTADYGDRWGARAKPAFRVGVLLFNQCHGVALRDLTILNSDAWTLHLYRCDTVNIEGITISNNYRRVNTDGIDPDMCRYVRIARCRIYAGDDCIVLKTAAAHPCENVTVTDCVLESASSALKLGTESYGDFRNIVFANCVISNSPVGIGFYLKDGGTIEHVSCSNIIIRPCSTFSPVVAPVFMDIERRNADSKVGHIRDVRFQRFDITTGSGILVQGMSNSPIEQVTFHGVLLRVPQADEYAKRKKPVGGHRTFFDGRDLVFARLPSYFTVAYVRQLVLENITVKIAKAAFQQYDRSAFAGRFLNGVRITGLRRSPGENEGKLPVIEVQDCEGVEVQ